MVCRHRCAICGKKKPETSGYFFTIDYLKSLGVQSLFDADAKLWVGRVYACDRCTRPLERAKADDDWAKLMRVKEEWKIEKDQKLRDDLKSVLTTLCDRDCWVRIKDITELFNKQGHHESSKTMSIILRENGFTQIKQRTHGYYFVFVEHEKIRFA